MKFSHLSACGYMYYIACYHRLCVQVHVHVHCTVQCVTITGCVYRYIHVLYSVLPSLAVCTGIYMYCTVCYHHWLCVQVYTCTCTVQCVTITGCVCRYIHVLYSMLPSLAVCTGIYMYCTVCYHHWLCVQVYTCTCTVQYVTITGYVYRYMYIVLYSVLPSLAVCTGIYMYCTVCYHHWLCVQVYTCTVQYVTITGCVYRYIHVHVLYSVLPSLAVCAGIYMYCTVCYHHWLCVQVHVHCTVQCVTITGCVYRYIHVLYSMLPSLAVCAGIYMYCTVCYHHWLCVQVYTCIVQCVTITGCVCRYIHVLYSMLPSLAVCTGIYMYCTVCYHHWLCVQVYTCTVQYVTITGCVCRYMYIVLYSVLPSLAVCAGIYMYCTVCYHHWLCVQVYTCTVQYVTSLAVCTGIYMYCTVCYHHWLCVQADDYVTVEAPAKKQRLLTEHQMEKRRERSDGIPTMYNALDPSQDASQLAQYTADPPLPDRYMYMHYIHINSVCTCTSTCAFYIYT